MDGGGRRTLKMEPSTNEFVHGDGEILCSGFGARESLNRDIDFFIQPMMTQDLWHRFVEFDCMSYPGTKWPMNKGKEVRCFPNGIIGVEEWQ